MIDPVGGEPRDLDEGRQEERSAEGHVERIRQRLGVRSRAQIATWWASGRGN
jgi:hypothetical protein